MSDPRALNAEDRKVCWNARDEYFECLDKNNEDSTMCSELKTKYEEQCPKRWVKYFVSKRFKDNYAKRLKTEGAVLADEKQ